MKRKTYRAFAAICAAMMAMSTMPVSAAAADVREASVTQEAAAVETASTKTVVGDAAGSYVFAATDLEIVDQWGTETSVSDDGKQIVEFGDKYAQIYYKLPEGVTGDRIEKIKVQTSSKEFSVKLCADDGEYGDIGVVYGAAELSKGSFDPDKDLSTAKYLCLMNLDDAAQTKEIGNITFVLKAAAGAETGDATDSVKPVSQTKGEYVYNAKDLYIESEVGCQADNTKNNLTVGFEDKYAQVIVEIPSAIDPSKIKSIEVKTTASMKSFSVKLLENHDNYQEAGAVYENNIITQYDLNEGADKSKIKYIAFMNISEASMYCEISTVTIKVATESSSDSFDGIENDIPNLKDAVQGKTDNDFIVGAAICQSDLSDDQTMNLVKKHFNAVTIGNELKPDATFGYSNNNCPSPHYEEFNGERLYVPTLNFSRGDRCLEEIYDWNQAHPNDQIKVRGHVLTWHSQTPEWFFHEDYDTNKPYVDKATMTKRHEWYIKSVLEHYCGENGKYTDMFYGWDVVNEAVSDSTGTYRNANENSSWWAVYKSNEFIINAFRFANKYAPADIELYYNDYNEDVSQKCKGIVKLLKDVKNAEGTRIDGFGMQGHYHTSSGPSKEAFKAAAKAYADVVGKVQLTELDFKCSNQYDGTSATYDDENTRLAYRYKEIYDGILELREEGVDFEGMTIWGLVDKNSWLQTSNSVGGSANGNRKQMPLLFDDDYKAKPAYWSFVDGDQLAPETKTLEILQSETGKFDNAVAVTVGDASVKPIWTGDSLQVKFEVADTKKDASDAVNVFLSVDGKLTSYTVSRNDAVETANGYEAVVTVPYANAKVGQEVKIDFTLVNGSETKAFNDTKLTQLTSDAYYANGILKPFISIAKGTIKVDGKVDEAWDKVEATPLSINLGSQVAADAKLLWDEENLYVYFKVKDSKLNANSENVYEHDSVEVFIDENNHKSTSYEDDDKQYRVNFRNAQSFNGSKCIAENIESSANQTSDGYEVEMAMKWTDITPEIGQLIGLEMQVNDADYSDSRIGTLSWYDTTGQGWDKPSVFGTAVLADGDGAAVDPGQDNPGQDNPGQDNPGQDNPGQDNPGQDNPGQDNPGQDNPGQDNPGQDNPGQTTGKVVATKPTDARHHKFTAEQIEVLAEKDAVIEVAYTAESFENNWMNLSFISNGKKYASALYSVMGGSNTFTVKVADLVEKMGEKDTADILSNLEVYTWNGTVLDEITVKSSAEAGTVDPGQDNPGQENPGQDNPGQDNPGQENPGQDNPGQENPGQENPGQDNPGQEEPEAEKVTITTAAFGKEIDLSSYNPEKISKIVVKFKGSAQQYSGAVVLGEWVQQESFDNNITKDMTVEVTVKSPQKTLNVRKWWSNASLEIDSITLVY